MICIYDVTPTGSNPTSRPSSGNHTEDIISNNASDDSLSQLSISFDNNKRSMTPLSTSSFGSGLVNFIDNNISNTDSNKYILYDEDSKSDDFITINIFSPTNNKEKSTSTTANNFIKYCSNDIINNINKITDEAVDVYFNKYLNSILGNLEGDVSEMYEYDMKQFVYDKFSKNEFDKHVFTNVSNALIVDTMSFDVESIIFNKSVKDAARRIVRYYSDKFNLNLSISIVNDDMNFVGDDHNAATHNDLYDIVDMICPDSSLVEKLVCDKAFNDSVLHSLQMDGGNILDLFNSNVCINII